MNICIYYILSEEVIPRWNRTSALQRKMLPEWDGIPKVFISDRNLSIPVPGDRITTDLFFDGLMQFSKAKNLGFGWARDHGYDWVLDCDADTVILKMPEREPSTGYSSVGCHFSEQRDTDEDLIEKYMAGTMRYEPASRFILRRDIFTRHLFDEGYVDWTWDDIDYHANVLEPNGVLYEDTGAVGIHIWHSRLREKHGNGYSRFRMKRGLSFPGDIYP